MTIQGELSYGVTNALHGPMHSGLLAILGEDGEHYIHAYMDFGPGGSLSVNVSHIDTQDEFFWYLTQDEARTQLASLGLSGVTAEDWYFGQQGGVSVPGQPYIWIPMFSDYSGPARTVNILLRYKINSSGSVVFDGYTGGSCDSASLNSGSVGAIGYFIIGPGEVSNPVFGTQVIGTNAYFVQKTGAPNFFGANSVQYHLIRLPLTGNSFSDTSGSWDTYITRLPSSGDPYFTSTGGTPTNSAAIMSEPSGGVRVFVYMRNGLGISLGFGGAACTTTVVDPDLHTATAWQDCSSIFGIPFADTLYNFAGSLTSNFRNDYSGPTVIGTDVFFMRPFDDALNYARYRLFAIGGAGLTDIQVFDAVDGIYTTVDPAGLNTQCEFIQGYREDDILYTMGRFTTQYVFGNMGEYPNISPTPESEGGIPYYIERMDNRIWPTIDSAWCVDSALALPQPAPDATLAVSSATGDGAIRSYNIINGGSGYTSPVGQVFDAAGPGAGATVTLSVSSGVIVTATAVVIGQNYRMPAQLTVLDTTGAGAVIQPIVTNYTTLSTNTSSFTSSDVGSIVRVGGGKLEIVTVSSTTSVIGNVISPITYTMPNDPNNTPVEAEAGDWTMTVPTTTVSGLQHLEGMAVVALADGGVVTGLTVSDGAVTLPVAASQIVVGLPFVVQLQTMYLDLGGGPTVQTRRKDVTQAVLRVEASRAPEIGLNQPDAAAQPGQADIPWGARPYTALTQIKFRTPDMPAGQPAPLVSADLDITNLFSTWDSKGQVAVQQRDPVPLSVTALTLWVKIGDTTGQ